MIALMSNWTQPIWIATIGVTLGLLIVASCQSEVHPDAEIHRHDTPTQLHDRERD